MAAQKSLPGSDDPRQVIHRRKAIVMLSPKMHIYIDICDVPFDLHDVSNKTETIVLPSIFSFWNFMTSFLPCSAGFEAYDDVHFTKGAGLRVKSRRHNSSAALTFLTTHYMVLVS
jgi:hypothetical protein